MVGIPSVPRGSAWIFVKTWTFELTKEFQWKKPKHVAPIQKDGNPRRGRRNRSQNNVFFFKNAEKVFVQAWQALVRRVAIKVQLATKDFQPWQPGPWVK